MTADEGNFKPYNTDVVLEKTNLPILFINTCDEAGHTTAIHKDYQAAVRMKIINNADGVNYGDKWHIRGRPPTMRDG